MEGTNHPQITLVGVVSRSKMNAPPSPTPTPAHRGRKGAPTLSLLPLALPLRSTSSSRLFSSANVDMRNMNTATPRYGPSKPLPADGDTFRAWNKDSIDRTSSKSDKESQKGKGKRASLAYVVGAAHSESGEERDEEEEEDELDVQDHLGRASEELYRKGNGVDYIINWQVSTPPRALKHCSNSPEILGRGFGGILSFAQRCCSIRIRGACSAVWIRPNIPHSERISPRSLLSRRLRSNRSTTSNSAAASSD